MTKYMILDSRIILYIRTLLEKCLKPNFDCKLTFEIGRLCCEILKAYFVVKNRC